MSTPPSLSAYLEALRELESAPTSEVVLVGNLIVRVYPGETLEQAVAREVEQRPKTVALIKNLMAEPESKE